MENDTSLNSSSYPPGMETFIFFYFDGFHNLQDRAAKFVDKLSAIGGTMGLLTGFSLISGVEILYFIIKIVHNIVTEKLIQ